MNRIPHSPPMTHLKRLLLLGCVLSILPVCILYATLTDDAPAVPVSPNVSTDFPGIPTLPPIPGLPDPYNPFDPDCDPDPICDPDPDPDPPTNPVVPPQICDPFAGLYGKNVTIVMDGDVALRGMFMQVCSGFIILQDRSAGRHNVINIGKISYIELLAQHP